jgi:quinol monooxygenase YgiN
MARKIEQIKNISIAVLPAKNNLSSPIRLDRLCRLLKSEVIFGTRMAWSETLDQRKRRTLQFGVVGGAAALLLTNIAQSSTARAVDREVKMNLVTLDPAATTLVNVLTCDPANQGALLDLLRQNIDAVIVTLDGWRWTSLVAAQDGTRVTIISQWRDPAAVSAMQGDARMKAYFPRIAALAAFDSVAGNVAYARHA